MKAIINTPLTHEAVSCTPCGPMCQFSSREATSELTTSKMCAYKNSKGKFKVKYNCILFEYTKTQKQL